MVYGLSNGHVTHSTPNTQSDHDWSAMQHLVNSVVSDVTFTQIVLMTCVIQQFTLMSMTVQGAPLLSRVHRVLEKSFKVLEFGKNSGP